MVEMKRLNLSGASHSDASDTASPPMRYYEYTDKRALTDVLLATPIKDIETELATYTKAQLSAVYRTVYETSPLSAYDKSKIAKHIIMYTMDTHRAVTLLGRQVLDGGA